MNMNNKICYIANNQNKKNMTMNKYNEFITTIFSTETSEKNSDRKINKHINGKIGTRPLHQDTVG